MAVGGAGLSAMRALAHRFGHEVSPIVAPSATAEDARRDKLLSGRNVSLVLDVGANSGQYTGRLRSAGYEGRVISFEPLAAAFSDLERHSAGDPNWEVRRLALGDEDGEAEINIAGNSYSSSLLNMEERHVQSAPESAYVGTEPILEARLDSIWSEITHDGEIVFLKLDVQGFEMAVLRGAEASLDHITGVQAELSLVPLYEGAPTYLELISYLGERGFRLAGLEAGHDDRETGELLQADGIFIR